MDAPIIKHRVYDLEGFRGLVDLHLEAHKELPTGRHELETLQYWIHQQNYEERTYLKCVDDLINKRSELKETA